MDDRDRMGQGERRGGPQTADELSAPDGVIGAAAERDAASQSRSSDLGKSASSNGAAGSREPSTDLSGAHGAGEAAVSENTMMLGKAADARVYPGASPAARGVSAPGTGGQRRMAAGLALVSIALIIATLLLAFGIPGAGNGLWTTTADVPAGSAASVTGDGTASDEAATTSTAGSDGSANAGSGAAGADSDGTASASAGEASSSGASSPSASSGEVGGGSSASGADGSAGATADPGASSGQTGGSAAPKTVTVTVLVSAAGAGGGTLASTTLTFERGATVYDALMGTGLSVSAESTVYGLYVTTIGGYAAHGSEGWKYAVNGVDGDRSAARYVLKDGDAVSWYWGSA